MFALPAHVKKHADELRKSRQRQRHVTSDEAARQCRQLESAGPTQCPIREVYDPEVDASYLQISARPVKTTREYHGIVLVDTDAEGKICGIELLGDGPIETANAR